MPRHAAEAKPSDRTRWRGRLISLAAIWAVWALVSTFVVQPFKIPSGSMEKSLAIGDRFVVEKWVGGSDVKRGDVVVFKDSQHWLGDDSGGSTGWSGAIRSAAEFTRLTAGGAHLVKRVVGLPGDRVSCPGVGGKLTVNSVTVDEPYVHPGVRPCDEGTGVTTFAVTVPAGHLWVMGDNRNDSADSRVHHAMTGGTGGFVPFSDVTGKGLAVVWPLGNLAGGHNDEGAFAKVPAATK